MAQPVMAPAGTDLDIAADIGACSLNQVQPTLGTESVDHVWRPGGRRGECKYVGWAKVGGAGTHRASPWIRPLDILSIYYTYSVV